MTVTCFNLIIIAEYFFIVLDLAGDSTITSTFPLEVLFVFDEAVFDLDVFFFSCLISSCASFSNAALFLAI